MLGVGWSFVALVVLAVLYLTQTGRGQGVVLEEVLERARGIFAGELVVEDIRTSTLLFGLRRGGGLLSLLILPVVMPVLIFGARATDLAVVSDTLHPRLRGLDPPGTGGLGAHDPYLPRR